MVEENFLSAPVSASRWRRMNGWLFNILAAFSLLMFVTTVILWWRGQLCIEDGVNLPFIGKCYCGIDCFGGKIEVSATRYYETLMMIQHARNNWGHPTIREYAPPQKIEFYSIWVVKLRREEQPRFFESFNIKRENLLFLGDLGGYWHISVEVPYWFLALFFAILPLWWLKRSGLCSMFKKSSQP